MVSPTSLSSRVLLVEGVDDKHVVGHLCARSGLTVDWKIEDKGDVDALLRSIGPEVKVSGREAVGIIADANDDISGRWMAISSRLSNAGIAAPSQPDSQGTVISGSPRVGVWLMPDNCQVGQLEDLMAAMVPSGDRIWPLAVSFISSIPAAERPAVPIKAEVHAWLAGRTQGRRMGTAIKAGDLDISVPVALTFVDWIRRLFQL